MAKKKRVALSPTLAAKVLFISDRICCVCNIKGKPVQIHHIDDNPANNDIENLAVLCLDCHNETQIKGGFHKKLDAEQIILYRDNWLINVAKARAREPEKFIKSFDDNAIDVELATSIAEIYRDNEEYELLALHYMGIGNDELRDKYIEKAIEVGIDDSSLVFFRSEQHKQDLIPQNVIDKLVKKHIRSKDYLGLGRLYRSLNNPKEAVINICKGVLNALKEDNVFSAAFYLKEMMSDGDLEKLFLIALDEAKEEKDLWWQLRALQELEWDTEINEFFNKHKDEIIKSEDRLLLQEYYANSGDWDKYAELRKEDAKNESAKL